ncbi:MAG: precorrin-6y C5,15-methyltransferase (decarboxylating) subunit CbiE, partial [Victivallales bacterium]|nr:precorrin-6y C5,15-methyltransferase (decarboxylating) subunit CbiE [Victivallales bacterium]
MKNKGHVYVIGCGISPDDFSEAGKDILNRVPVIVGGKRLLELFAPEDKELITIASDAVKIAENIAVRAKHEEIAVLASGDSLFHGIAATLSKVLNPESFSVIPNITAFQYFFAKLGISWSDARLFSIHGGKSVPWRRILSRSLAAVYCDHTCNFSQTAAELIRVWAPAASRQAFAGVKLGTKDENILRGTLLELSQEDIPGISMLALPETGSAYLPPPLPLGVEDENYEHVNKLITHPETRAVILSKLRLHGGIIWDIGAGSGSVGIEAAGICPELEVYSIEKSPERSAQLQKNIASEGLNNITAFNGNVLELIDTLPVPDTVFIGGGGPNIGQIVETAFAKL